MYRKAHMNHLQCVYIVGVIVPVRALRLLKVALLLLLVLLQLYMPLLHCTLLCDKM